MDYYIKYASMNEDELLDEIEMLNKKIFKIRTNHTIRSQMLDMLHTAEGFYKEAQLKKRVSKDDEIIEIGSITSDVIELEYSSQELLNILVTEYTQGITDESSNIK